MSTKENNASKVLKNSVYNKEDKQLGEVTQTDKTENSKNDVVPYNEDRNNTIQQEIDKEGVGKENNDKTGLEDDTNMSKDTNEDIIAHEEMEEETQNPNNNEKPVQDQKV